MLLILYLFLIFYALFLCGCVYSWYKNREEEFSRIPDTEVSVVICARNEEKNIGHLLEQLIQQTCKAGEIIVVDDGSVDATAEIISTFSSIKMIRLQGGGKKQALRYGIEQAKFNWIVCVDADCSITPRWLQSVLCSIEKCNSSLLIAPVRMNADASYWQQLQALEFLSLAAVTAGSALMQHPMMCNGANLAFRKNIWLQAFDYLKLEEPSGDDMFFLMCCKKQRIPIRYIKSRDAMVTIEPSCTTKEFENQRQRWISKGKSYKDPEVIGLAILTLMVTLSPVVLLIFGQWKSALILWSIKTVVDALFVRQFAFFFDTKASLKTILILALVYPFYVFYIGVVGFMKPVHWK